MLQGQAIDQGAHHLLLLIVELADRLAA